jgi:hypothetical protein
VVRNHNQAPTLKKIQHLCEVFKPTHSHTGQDLSRQLIRFRFIRIELRLTLSQWSRLTEILTGNKICSHSGFAVNHIYVLTCLVT